MLAVLRILFSKPIKVIIPLSCIATSLCLPSPLLAREKDHEQLKAGEPCTSCHVDLNHGGARGLFSDECAICHSSFDPKKLRAAPAFNSDIEPPMSTPTSTDPKAGMIGKMYYEKSRLGDAPNKMILIPAGEFTMGTDDRLPDEGPAHKVSLPAYYIDKYEATNLQYKKFNDATNRRSPSHFINRTYPKGKADHPVTFVSWYDAKAYCEWAGKRLPTDAEWEKAARGTDARIFPWGNEFDDNKANTPLRWEALKRDGDTTPVGSFPGGVSPYGLYDMSGNVWEWTASWYLPYPGNKRKTENYGEKYKVLKGGSWWDCSFYKCGISAPSYNRAFFLPSTRTKSFGFRCAKDARQ